jgi:hypothetical protein
MFRQLILVVPVMRTEPTLSSHRRSRQSTAFGAAIEENFASAIVDNASRRSFNKGLISRASETQYVCVIGEATGISYVFTRLSLRLHIASALCRLHCCDHVPECSLLNRSHEVGVPVDDIVSDVAFVFHRSTKCVAPTIVRSRQVTCQLAKSAITLRTPNLSACECAIPPDEIFRITRCLRENDTLLTRSDCSASYTLL